MITAPAGVPFLIQVFKILKKWLTRFARSSNASLFILLLLLLRRFAVTRLSRLSDRPTCFSTGAIQGDNTRKDVFISSSLPGRKVIRNSPSQALSDDPYARIHAQSLRKSRLGEMPSWPELAADPTASVYTSVTAEPYGFPSDSVSSLRLSQRTGESQSPPASPIPYDRKGKSVERGSKESWVVNGAPLRHPLQDSGSPSQPSPSIGPHRLSASQLRTPSLTSRSSLYYSATPSVATSRSRQSKYRTHTGPVHSRPVSIRGSFMDLHHGAGPESVSGIDHHYHLTVPPVSDDALQPGIDIVSVHSGPLMGEMVTDGVRRYERCNPRAIDTSDTTIPAMAVEFPVHDKALPTGWITVVHPEGCRYFLNPENRTFTEFDVCEEDICRDVEYYMRYLLYVLRSELKLKNLELDMELVDLVIEPKTRDVDGLVVGNYYFVNHRDRCLFWLDDFDAKKLLKDCKGIKSLSHKGLAIQAQYWKHWDYFPSLCPVAQNLVDEVENMLVHAICDHLTSKQSCAAYDIDKLKDYLSVVQRVKVPSADQRIEQCHAAIFIGRIMQVFSHNAFINFHGEDCARLSYDQTVHGWAYKPSWLMVFLAPVLFLEPVTQVQELHKIFADQIARVSRWNAFSSRLKRQLQESNILATVLLNANVAFLGMSKGSNYDIQMSSYMSLVASFGSIVLGLLFVSQDRISGESTADETGSFLSGLHDTKRGLQSLAIIYSLPKALLMWGMVLFFVAFSMYWCTSGDVSSRVIVGAMTLLVLVMIGISIIRTKEGGHWWSMIQEVMGKQTQGDDEGSEMGKDSTGTPTDHEVDRPIRSPFPDRSIFTTSTASVRSPHHHNDGNSSILHSPHLRPSTSLLLGGGRLGHNQEETPAASQVHPPGEARCEPEPSPHVHFATSTATNELMPPSGTSTTAIIPSEYKEQTAAATDSGGTAISPDPLRLDGKENEECIVEEPEEDKRSDSTTSLPKFHGRGPTGDDFGYALQSDNQDITETRDE